MVQYRLVINGRVQDVGFRLSACAYAKACGVTGWIMNRRDGHVECVIQGTEDGCQRFIAWAKNGPASANVTALNMDEEKISEIFHDFRVRRLPFFGIPH